MSWYIGSIENRFFPLGGTLDSTGVIGRYATDYATGLGAGRTVVTFAPDIISGAHLHILFNGLVNG